MGILDDLKQQAAETKVNQESEAQRRARLEENYRHNMLPKMQAILRYLHDMQEQLRVVELEIPFIYNLPEIGPEQFYQQLFKVNVDRNDQIKKIALQMECVAAESATYAINTTAAADEVRAFLDRQSAQYTEWAIRDANDRICGANFEGRLKVKVRMLLQANVEEDQIEILSSNFEELTTKKMRFRSEQVDDAWLDELGHYLLRKDTRLGALEISEDHKEFIRSQLLSWQEQRKKELEETGAAQPPEDEKGDNKGDRLLDSLRKTLNKPLW